MINEKGAAKAIGRLILENILSKTLNYIIILFDKSFHSNMSYQEIPGSNPGRVSNDPLAQR